VRRRGPTDVSSPAVLAEADFIVLRAMALLDTIARMTRFAMCFLLVFGELAFGGVAALAVPPFFKVERGFYKSTASVYLACGLATAAGIGALAWRASQGRANSETFALSPMQLWIICAIWLVFCLIFGVYLYTLWTENGALRAAAFTSTLATGLVAIVTNVIVLIPPSFGIGAVLAYAMTAITSSLVLGLVSGAMMFGHWYLIDLAMPVDYLRNFVRLMAMALIADAIAMGLTALLMGALAGRGASGELGALFDTHLVLLIARVLVNPIATMVLVWMCWQTLKIPQTMAATGLLYIAVMSTLVGEMLGRFILFRTALPL
jgi:hypothetical protein